MFTVSKVVFGIRSTIFSCGA